MHRVISHSESKYRRTPENSVDSFSSSEDDDWPTKEPINEHTAAAPSLIFSSIYGSRPNPVNRLQLSEVDLPVSPESLPDTSGRIQHRPSSSGRGSVTHTLAVASPISSRTSSRPVSASLGIGIGGRGQGLAEVFTALATSQAQGVALPPSSAGSLPSPLSLSPKSPAHGAQEIIVKDDNFTLEQFPFKLALSNQSSLLLNRTTRAAARENARRASTFPRVSPSPIKRPSNHSAPDRYNSISLPPHHLRNDDSFERPRSNSRSVSGSHKSDVPLDAGEESDGSSGADAEDESDDEPQFMKESPSFEALQPYPRDVSIEPSPDPAREGFGASVPVHEPEEDEGEPHRMPRRMDSDRKLDHERLLIELEERLNIEPSRRRARSGASATSTATTGQAGGTRARSGSFVRPSVGLGGSRSVAVPRSGVNMEAARGMLDALFAKRVAAMGGQGQEAGEEEGEEGQEEQEEEGEEKGEDMQVEYVDRETLEGDGATEGNRDLKDDRALGGEETLRGEGEEDLDGMEDIGVAFSTPERQQTQGDDLGLGSQSSPGDQSFLPTDWDIGSLDLDAHPLDLDARSGYSDDHTGTPVASRSMQEPRLDDQELYLVTEERRHITEDAHDHLDHDEHPEPHAPPESPTSVEEYSDSDHGSSDEFSSDDDPTEDYTELAEEHAVVTSSVVLRREIPRETSLPEIEATRNMSRMNSLLASTRSRQDSLVEVVHEEDSLGAMPAGSLVEAVSGQMVRVETLSVSSVVSEPSRVAPAPPAPDSPIATAEQAHGTTLGGSDAVLGDPSRLEYEDLDGITPIASRLLEPRPPVVAATHSMSPVPEARATSPVPEARAMSISTDPRAETEPPKRRSQLKPLRLSLLYGLKSPTSVAIAPNSARSTPTAPGFAAPYPQPDPSSVYPTPATAHPTNVGSGTAHSIPPSSNPRSAQSLVDVEEASEVVSVHGIGRGSFGPESVTWFGSKKGSSRGSLGDSVRRSVHARTQETIESAGRASSPTRRDGPQPHRATAASQFTTPDDEDVRPLPVIWDDETDADSRPGSIHGGRNDSGSDIVPQSPSLPIPMFEVPEEDRTPTAATIPRRQGSTPRYPAFVSVEGSSPRSSVGKLSLPLPALVEPTRASPEPRPELVPNHELTPRKHPRLIQEPNLTQAARPGREIELAPETETTRKAESSLDAIAGPDPELKQEPELKSEPKVKRGPEPEQKPGPQQEPTPEAETRPEPPARTRKWGDQTEEESIGSLPVFDTPAPTPRDVPAQSTPAPQGATRTDRLGYPHYAYPPLPNTAPLSISPRNVSPSMILEQEQEPYHQRIPWATPPLTAPLHLQMKMRAQQGETTPSPWMSEHFVNSPSSLHSSQMGSMHSASSSVTTADRLPGPEPSGLAKEYPVRTSSLRTRAFGDPGPGPSTMMTYSARKQLAEALGSPISLRSSYHSRVASLVNEPAPVSPKSLSISRRTSREGSILSNSVESIKADDEPTLKVSPEAPSTDLDFSARSASTRHARLQSPLRNTLDALPPSAQSIRFKVTFFESIPIRITHMLDYQPPSPPNSRSPRTPLAAHSPLQILRRNMMARPGLDSHGLLSPQARSTNLPESRSISHQHHGSLAPTMSIYHEDPHSAPMSAPLHQDRRSLTPAARFGGTSPRPGSPALSAQSAISQTKPLLFFAIAKNSAQEVERLLQEGEVQPNDKAGPEDLPALAFTLANEQLSDKTQIVKSLLSHGADPASVLHRKSGSGVIDDAELALSSRIEQGINPAIRYYLNRKRMTIPAQQAELLEKNNFDALTRTGFSIIGQDSALDELIRVVAGHCRRQTLNPLVIVFSGGPGCGKSLLASKIGPLLHVPYFTVNMTNLRNEASLFQYISMTVKPGSPQEIEKAADKTVWHSLLMPWEWGKATIISPTTNEQIDIDTTKVIWIATSNSGDDATLKFFAERSRPSYGGLASGESALSRLVHSPRPNDNNFTRKDYLQLMQAVRKRLGELLGSSMISRVSTVLPFLPFTEEEVLALASESLSAMREAQKSDQDLEDVDWDGLLQQAVGEYIPGEGARSVHRAVQRAFDEITEW
ncbi:hypothetical protein FRC10_009888 [Ceratobasidium sp. 414]|nr:hypothetical protein FRC10_009888 [Ceratobasidium sp. 414]